MSCSARLRYAARLLRKTPGFTATALLTLAICLGANLTIFAVIDSILLRPLPFPEADRLVTMFNTYPKAGVDRDGSSITNYYERRGRIPAFASLAIYHFGTAIVGEAGSTEREQITRVSPDFFPTLGHRARHRTHFHGSGNHLRRPTMSRFSPTLYWRQHFNADPHVIGSQIRVDGVPETVVGVLAARLPFPLLRSPYLFSVCLSPRRSRSLASGIREATPST